MLSRRLLLRTTAATAARRGSTSSISVGSGQEPRTDLMMLEERDKQRQLGWRKTMLASSSADEVMDLWEKHKSAMCAINRAVCMKRMGHFAVTRTMESTTKEQLDSFLKRVSLDGFQPGQAVTALIGVAHVSAASSKTEEHVFQLALELEKKLSKRYLAFLENYQVITVAWGFFTVARNSEAKSLHTIFPELFENISDEVMKRIDVFNPNQLCSIGYHLRDSRKVIEAVSARITPQSIESVTTDELASLVGGMKVYLEKKSRFDKRRMNAAAAAACDDDLKGQISPRGDEGESLTEKAFKFASEELEKRRGLMVYGEIARGIDEQAPASLVNEVVSACLANPGLLGTLDAHALARTVSYTVVRRGHFQNAVTKDLAEAMATQMKAKSFETISSNLLCKLAVALSRDVFDHDTAKALMAEKICPVVIEHHIDDIRAGDVARLVASCAKLGAGDAKTFYVPLSRRLLERDGANDAQEDAEALPMLIEYLNPLDLTHVAWAFGTVLEHGDGAYEDVFGAIVKTVRAKLNRFKGQQLIFLTRAFSASRYMAPSLFADVGVALMNSDALRGMERMEASPAETLRQLANLAHEFSIVGICEPEIYESLSAKAVNALRRLADDDISDFLLISQLSQLFVAFSITRAEVPDLFYETACPIAKRSLDRMYASKEDAPLKAVVQLCHALAVTGILQPDIVDGMWQLIGPEGVNQLNEGLKSDLHVVLLALRLECVECEFSRQVDANALLEAEVQQNEKRSLGHYRQIEASLKRVGLYDRFPDRGYVTEDGIFIDFANAERKEAILVPGKRAYLKRRVQDPREQYNFQLKGERHFRSRVLEHLGWQVHRIPYYLWIIFDTHPKQDAYIMRKLRVDNRSPHRASSL